MSTRLTSSMWEKAVTRHIGASGIGFTASRIGQTLHLPCSRGHVVDYPISGSKPPEFIAKKMIQQGWTIGHRLTCPEHSRKPKGAVEQCGTEAPKWDGRSSTLRNELHMGPAKPEQPKRPGPVPGTWGTVCAVEKINEALTQFPELTSPQLKDLTALSNGTLQSTLKRLRSGGTIQRRGEHGGYLYSLASTKIEPEEPMPEPTLAAVPTATDAARTAKRLTVMALEESFANGRYKPGVTDATIAKETGLSEAKVAEYRDEFFGPIKEPSEIEAARAALAALEASVADIEARFGQAVAAARADIEKQRQGITALVARNKW